MSPKLNDLFLREVDFAGGAFDYELEEVEVFHQTFLMRKRRLEFLQSKSYGGIHKP